ncbi:MAG: response regulator [Thermodesulfovibrionales bacterium]|nr:response regulator [Thermodesulfovibrionales bacterium]
MNERILVIDDEPLILATIERALSKLGYAVRTTGSVADFLDALSTAAFDLLIMDLHLGSISPDVLLEKVRAITPETKILTVSGSNYGFPEECFLQKPFKIDDLRHMVREMLDSPPCHRDK